jgi:hypothetical protein
VGAFSLNGHARSGATLVTKCERERAKIREGSLGEEKRDSSTHAHESARMKNQKWI